MLVFFVLHSSFDVGRSMFDVHLLICSMFIILSFNHLWISISSFNEMLAFFVLHSSFDVGRSMFDVHLLICSMFDVHLLICSMLDVHLLNGNHLDLGPFVQPFGVHPDFNQSVGFDHCVYKS
jgi:hypothetical protein